VVPNPSGATEYQLRVVVGQCPTECISEVTPQQQAVLDGIMERARNGEMPLDEAGFTLYELLARARYENGRWRGPKRRPKSTSQHVDWF
jgi:hypothetical protein